MIIVRIVQFVKIVQLVQLDYYGYIKFFGVFVGTWVGAFTYQQIKNADFMQHSTASISSNVTLFMSFSKTLVAN